jgi:hypothetical protein
VTTPAYTEAAMSYTINATTSAPALSADWSAAAWSTAETAVLNNLRPESSDHRPRVAVRLLHDDQAIYGIYQVQDRYVRVVQEGYQVPVCTDSCVEFFFKPPVGVGYFNLEMNAGGAYLFSYVRNPRRTEDGFVDFTRVASEHGSMIKLRSTMPKRVEPEITTPVTWCIQFTLPFAALEPYCGALDEHIGGGATWTGNFFKCGDHTSHPHWLTWAPIPLLNFHQPAVFAPIILA